MCEGDWIKLKLFVLFGMLLPIQPLYAQTPTRGVPREVSTDDAGVGVDYCAVCHANTVNLFDLLTDSERVEQMVIDIDMYRRSSHGKLNCLDCHGFAWPFFPHPKDALEMGQTCLSCHKDEEKFRSYRFEAIDVEMRRSVHFQKQVERFSCFSCHEPHLFKLPDPKDEIRLTVSASNDTCNKCHVEKQSASTARTIGSGKHSLEKAHNWMPKPELHWKYVRCIECHTPHKHELSHRILSATEAEHKCEACHSQNSILLTKLYKHRASENKRRLGFVNSIVLNDAYIIGMTRNTMLDSLFLVLLSLVAVGVGSHATLRFIAAKRRRKRVG